MALVHLTVHLYLQTRFEKLLYPTDPPFHSNSSGRSWFFGVLTAYSSYIICSPFLTSHTCNNLNKGIDKPLMICSTTLNPTSTSLVQFSPELHWMCICPKLFQRAYYHSSQSVLNLGHLLWSHGLHISYADLPIHFQGLEPMFEHSSVKTFWQVQAF